VDHVGLVRTVAVLDYVGGHFELEQSDMIFTPFSGPVLWIGEEQIMIDSLLPRASSLARLIEQPLNSYIRRQTWRGKGAADTDRSRSQVGPV
jgi:hypothetical protein